MSTGIDNLGSFVIKALVYHIGGMGSIPRCEKNCPSELQTSVALTILLLEQVFIVPITHSIILFIFFSV